LRLRFFMLVLSGLTTGALTGFVAATTASPRADLVPQRHAAQGLCHRVSQGRSLVVVVRNVGAAAAPRSTTTVEFLPGGSFDLPTPALLPKAIFGLPPVDFPVGCFNQDCDLKITVDSRNAVREFDERNNTAVGVCRREFRSDKVPSRGAVVKDAQQRAEAEKLARDTEGVKKANNLIKVGDLREPTKASTVIGHRAQCHGRGGRGHR